MGGGGQFRLIGFSPSCLLYLFLCLAVSLSLSGHKKQSCWKMRLLDCDRMGWGGLGTLCSLEKYNVFAGHDYNEGDNDTALIGCSAFSNPNVLIRNSIYLLCCGILCLAYLCVIVPFLSLCGQYAGF